MSFHIPGSCGGAQRAERRAVPSRPVSPRGTGSRTRETRGAILLPIFQLVEQVQ